MYGRHVFMNDVEGGYPEYVMQGVRLVRASRDRCPVCAHPTGDCAGETKVPRVLGADFAPKRGGDPDVLVTEDLYESIQLTPRTATRVLVAKAGTYISHEKALSYGLLDD
jgi:hypothetical protein